MNRGTGSKSTAPPVPPPPATATSTSVSLSQRPPTKEAVTTTAVGPAASETLERSRARETAVGGESSSMIAARVDSCSTIISASRQMIENSSRPSATSSSISSTAKRSSVSPAAKVTTPEAAA